MWCSAPCMGCIWSAVFVTFGDTQLTQYAGLRSVTTGGHSNTTVWLTFSSKLHNITVCNHAVLQPVTLCL